jgi:hypothetical protein
LLQPTAAIIFAVLTAFNRFDAGADALPDAFKLLAPSSR